MGKDAHAKCLRGCFYRVVCIDISSLKGEEHFMTKRNNAPVYREPITWIDPLRLSTKLNLRKRTITILYSVSFGLLITNFIFNHPYQPNSLFVPLAMLGAVFLRTCLGRSTCQRLKSW